MKKPKKLICYFILLSLLLGSFSSPTVFASETMNDIKTYAWENTFIDDENVKLRPGYIYTSNTFNVENRNKINFLFLAEGTAGTQNHYYSFSLQLKESDGSWYTIKNYILHSRQSRSTEHEVIPGREYRIQAVTNDQYAKFIDVTVFK